MTRIVPVASGKGGVGKSVFVTNLGLSLVAQGKTVVLVDLDLGGSNLHTCLGLKNRFPGVGNYIYKLEDRLEALLVKTEVDRLFFIPGDCLLPGTANLNFFTKKKIIKGLLELMADYVLLDLSGGSAFNTLDFFLISASGIIITTPETTAVLNAYGFLKAAIYRLLTRSFPYRSEERGLIQSFAARRMEGADISFRNLLDKLEELKESSREVAAKHLQEFFPRIVLNKGKHKQELSLGARLRKIARTNLGVEMEYIGFLPYDHQVTESIARRSPSYTTYPGSKFSRAIDRVARRLINGQDRPNPELYEANEDLINLSTESEMQ